MIYIIIMPNDDDDDDDEGETVLSCPSLLESEEDIKKVDRKKGSCVAREPGGGRASEIFGGKKLNSSSFLRLACFFSSFASLSAPTPDHSLPLHDPFHKTTQTISYSTSSSSSSYLRIRSQCGVAPSPPSPAANHL